MKRILTIAIALSSLLSVAEAKVKLPAVLSDHMVLQQKTEVKLWGWADGKKVSVTTSWDKKTYKTTAAEDGSWSVKVSTQSAGFTPYSIKFSDGETTVLNDVLVGEVWICSGQSNMDMMMRGNSSQPVANSLENIMKSGKYRNSIRHLRVPRTNDPTPRSTFEGASWQCASPEVIIDASAVAYYFAKNLTETLEVPVGILTTSWGGSTIESWMDRETLETVAGADVEKAASTNKAQHQRLQYLFDTMLSPVIGYTAKGFLWYQGESNIFNYHLYAEMTKAMVQLWRSRWGNQEMPFYAVEISPYNYSGGQETGAALLREAQFKAGTLLDNYGLVSTIDIGEELCIHPARKDVVGFRLANMALVKTYGMDVLPAAGPTVSKIEYTSGKAIVHFETTFRGLLQNFQNIKAFEIAGKDKVFYKACATVKNKTTVEVWCDAVPEPVAVRYAFRNSPGEINLFDNFGTPAYPFRSDDWDDVVAAPNR